MDKETLDIQHQLKMIGDMVEHEGWAIVERSFLDRVEAIQNLANIQIMSPEQLFLELKARKHAIDIVSGWLNDIHGTAEVAKQNVTSVKESYIIQKE